MASKSECIAKYSKSSGISKSTLEKVYKRGLGAYYSSGSRPVCLLTVGLVAVSVLLLLAKAVQEKQIKIYTGQKNLKKEIIMPRGKGTYGSKVGRPPKKETNEEKI